MGTGTIEIQRYSCKTEASRCEDNRSKTPKEIRDESFLDSLIELFEFFFCHVDLNQTVYDCYLSPHNDILVEW